MNEKNLKLLKEIESVIFSKKWTENPHLDDFYISVNIDGEYVDYRYFQVKQKEWVVAVEEV